MKIVLMLTMLCFADVTFAQRPCEKNAEKIARQILRTQENRNDIQVRLVKAEVLPRQDEMTVGIYDYRAYYLFQGRRMDLQLTFSRLTMIQDDVRCVLLGYTLPEGN